MDNLTDEQLHVVYTENGGAFTTGIGIKHPVSGVEYHCLVDSNFKNNNETWVSVLVRHPGQPFPTVPTHKLTATHKLDGAYLFGDDKTHSLHVWGITHSIGPRNPDGSRPICLEHAELHNAYN